MELTEDQLEVLRDQPREKMAGKDWLLIMPPTERALLVVADAEAEREGLLVARRNLAPDR